MAGQDGCNSGPREGLRWFDFCSPTFCSQVHDPFVVDFLMSLNSNWTKDTKLAFSLLQDVLTSMETHEQTFGWSSQEPQCFRGPFRGFCAIAEAVIETIYSSKDTGLIGLCDAMFQRLLGLFLRIPWFGEEVSLAVNRCLARLFTARRGLPDLFQTTTLRLMLSQLGRELTVDFLELWLQQFSLVFLFLLFGKIGRLINF